MIRSHKAEPMIPRIQPTRPKFPLLAKPSACARSDDLPTKIAGIPVKSPQHRSETIPSTRAHTPKEFFCSYGNGPYACGGSGTGCGDISGRFCGSGSGSMKSFTNISLKDNGYWHTPRSGPVSVGDVP